MLLQSYSSTRGSNFMANNIPLLKEFNRNCILSRTESVFIQKRKTNQFYNIVMSYDMVNKYDERVS